MKPKPIGIVGGAGPIAGTFLLERIFLLSGKKYGCYRDADFPQAFLLSFPFSEMLRKNRNLTQIREELSACLQQLRRNGASVLAIACNTLHLFLDERDDLGDLVHLPRSLAAKIPETEVPMVFCTSTSAKSGLHRQFFPCVYPEKGTQSDIDELIDLTLKGVDRSVVLNRLAHLIERQMNNTIILGCTELSLYSSQLSQINKLILDPLEVTAHQVLEMSFN